MFWSGVWSWLIVGVIELVIGEYVEDAFYTVELVIELVIAYVVCTWTAWTDVGTAYSLPSRT